MPKRLAGAQLLHKTNITKSPTLEGYITDQDFDNLVKLSSFSGTRKEYTNLTPGLYKVKINGIYYALCIHENIVSPNKLVIEGLNKAYTIMGATAFHIPMYLIHNGYISELYGQLVDHSVNDHFDLLCIDGKSKISGGDNTMDHPSKIDFCSIMNIRVTKLDGTYDEYLFNMKTYLNSLEYTNLNVDYVIYDRCYIDKAVGRALFVLKTTRYIMNGFEEFIEESSYSNDDVMVLYLKNTSVKKKSYPRCSHLKLISWAEMIDKSVITEGICAGQSSSTIGLWIKLPRAKYPNKEAFLEACKYWYNVSQEEIDSIREQEYQDELSKVASMGLNSRFAIKKDAIASPIVVLYENTNPVYKNIALDSYDINTYYNKCWICVEPYSNETPEIIAALDDVIGLVPKDGRMRSYKELISSSYSSVMNAHNVYRQLTFEEYDITPDMPNGVNDINTLVAVIPHSGDVLDITPLLNQSYSQTLSENDIWDMILTPDIMEDQVVILDPTVVALVPKNGVIKSIAEQMEESGLASAYQRILNENYVYRDLLVSGVSEVNIAYFYKHLRLAG